MLALVDEYGDCGMKSLSNPFFTLSAVLFETDETADLCNTAIGELKTKLGMKQTDEFKFEGISDPKRHAFCEMAGEHDFTYIVSIVQKSRLSSTRWKDKKYFYDESCSGLMSHLDELLRIAHCCTERCGRALVDDNEDPVYLAAIQKHLRRPKTEDGRPIIRKARPRRSQTSNLLQLADMVCGATMHSWRGSDTYERLLRRRRISVDLWPRK